MKHADPYKDFLSAWNTIEEMLARRQLPCDEDFSRFETAKSAWQAQCAEFRRDPTNMWRQIGK